MESWEVILTELGSLKDFWGLPVKNDTSRAEWWKKNLGI